MNNKFKISLKDNGLHSLEKGLETFKLYEEDKNDFLLKESIMFLHHGIELLMKQVLVEKAGEYLIYSDISDDTVKKVINAKKQSISVFSLPKPPHTATYLEVIGRIRAFVDKPNMEESLETRLKDLNNTRNNIEHYAIDDEKEKIENLIRGIKTPLIKFLELGINGFKKDNSPNVKNKWEDVNQTISEYQRIENEVYQLIQNFDGQMIDGKLLGTSGNIKLPKFSKINKNYMFKFEKRRFGVDVLAKVDEEVNWIIEVKNRVIGINGIEQVLFYSSMIKNSKTWLIIFDKLTPQILKKAQSMNVYISGIDEWEQLKKIIKL
ncbi:MAG: hypothetical protein U0354_15270 [Candidatus Sericytochromatia bacterium]